MFKSLKNGLKKMKDLLRRREAAPAILLRSRSTTLPEMHDAHPSYDEGGRFMRSYSTSSRGVSSWVPSPPAVTSENGRALRTDQPPASPHVLRIATDATWSEALQIWIVSMVAQDHYDRVVYAKLRGYESSLPLDLISTMVHETRIPTVKTFDSELYGLYEAAVTAGRDIDLSPYHRIDFITDSKNVVDNINVLHIHPDFIFSKDLVLSTRSELKRLLQDHPVHVFWRARCLHVLPDQFGRRVRLACERHSFEPTVNTFVSDLKGGFVYANTTIEDLIQDLNTHGPS